MPIFEKTLQRINPSDPQAIKKMENHIRYLQEQLEYTLYNLDSRNINEIDVNKTTITDSSGQTNTSTFIYIKGDNGESFTVGKPPDGKFEFSVKGKNGTRVMHLDSLGNLVITSHANLTIDGGNW